MCVCDNINNVVTSVIDEKYVTENTPEARRLKMYIS